MKNVNHITLYQLYLLNLNAISRILLFPLKQSFLNWCSNKGLFRKLVYQFIIIELFVILLDIYFISILFYIVYNNRLSSKISLFFVFSLITLSNHGHPEYLLMYLFIVMWLFVTYIVASTYEPFADFIKKEIGADLIQFLVGEPLGSRSVKPILILLGFSLFKYFDFFITSELVHYKTQKCIQDLRESGAQTSFDLDTLDRLYKQMEFEVGPGLLNWAEDHLVQFVMMILDFFKS